MTVNVYGRLDGKCQLCESAKAKLDLMEVPYQCFELSKAIAWHEGWRDDESVEVAACYSDIDTYPVICIDGEAMSYPAAIKLLKSIKPKPVAQPEPAMIDFRARVEAGELVAVG